MPHLSSDGYEVRELSASSLAIIFDAIVRLEDVLGAPLESYHERVQHEDMARHQRALEIVADVPQRVIIKELDYFAQLIGMDLHIQARPYLRISRPGEERDNVGMHKDVWYGDSAYEVSVWIPLTDTDDGSALRVAPGSHLWDEREHPVVSFDAGIEKGSAKHALGFAYAPKRLEKPVPTIPVKMRVGEMLVFPLSLLHGVEVNTSPRTRVSLDCRIANSLAGVPTSRSRDPNYYERLTITPLTEQALRYAIANG